MSLRLALNVRYDGTAYRGWTDVRDSALRPTLSKVLFKGDLDSLRRNKDDVKEVATGFECGVGTDRFANWEEGDRIEAFKMVTQRRKLTT